jgi:hypothetical protein
MEFDQKSLSEHGPSCCKATARKKKKKKKVKRGNATATSGRDNATDRADTASQPDRTERVGASEERGTPTPPPVFKGEIVRRNEAIDILPERRLAANQDTIDVLPERRLAANHVERRPAAGNGLEQDGTAANTGVVVVTSSFTTPCTDACTTKSSIVSARCGEEEDTPVRKREESRAVDDIARSELVPVPLDDGLQVPDREDACANSEGARSSPEDARSGKKSAASRRRYREHAKARWFVLNAILLGEGGVVDTAWAVLRKRQKRRTLHVRGKKPLLLGLLLDSAKTAKEKT